MSSLMLINPAKKRRRRTTKKRKTVARKRPARRITTKTLKRRRRNPIRRRGMGGIMAQVMPAATAAFGALGLDIMWGYIPIPDMLKVGPMRYVAKAAGAIGLGMLAGMVVKKSTADQFATGALTVVLHQAMKEGMTSFAPNIQMGEYMNEGMGYWGAGWNPGNSMGEYLDYQGNSPIPSMSLNGADEYSTITM